ncbi:MAG: hypothetical protein EXS05_20225 [Planctomycetaceae bacterium]|nr:hypothetical protein [Planctomycetaceae bacterium]
MQAAGAVESECFVSLEAGSDSPRRTGGDGAGWSRAGTRSGAATCRTRARHPHCVNSSLSLDSALHFRPRRVRDVYAGIDQVVLRESFAASALCAALEVSRSGFYAWRSEEESHRAETDRELTPEIIDIFWHHRRRYEARRIAMELAQRGIACGVARVARLLENQGLHAIQPKSFRPRTTESRHHLGYNANLLKDRKASLKVDEVWVGDKQPSPAEPWRG